MTGLRPRRQRTERDDTNRWLTTYADLVTLLLAFFVLLFTMSEIDAAKFRDLLEGLTSSFGNTGMQRDILDGGETVTSDEPMVDETTLSIFEEHDHLDDGDEPDDSEGEDTEPSEPTDDLAELREEIVRSLDDAELSYVADLEIDPRGLVIAIGTDRVLFETGSARISPVGESIIAAIAPPLQPIGNEVLIEGHADDRPIAEVGYDNWNLAADRSLAVLRLFEEDHDLAPARLAATTFGAHRPRADNDTPEGRRQNRRVEILVAREGDR